LLLNRYKDIDYVFNLAWNNGIELINKAIGKRNEQRDWEMWLSVYPNMDKKTFVSFEKFQQKGRELPQNNFTTAEIIEKAEEIRKIHQGIHEGVNSPPPKS
jgi:hypothetical protein